MNKLAAIFAALALTACLDNGSTGTGTETDMDLSTAEVLDSQTLSDGASAGGGARTDEGAESPAAGVSRTDASAESVCTKVVATDGPCAVICKPEALIAFIPEGSCATFVCDLEDGAQYRAGGCNL